MYRYSNAENSVITDGERFVPVDLNNSDYARLVAEGVAIAPYEPPVLPPPAITRRQLRLWLVRNGVTTLQVETVIAAIQPDQAREEAWIEWQDASSYERANPLVVQVGQALGLTDAQMDDAFREAATF